MQLSDDFNVNVTDLLMLNVHVFVAVKNFVTKLFFSFKESIAHVSYEALHHKLNNNSPTIFQ